MERIIDYNPVAPAAPLLPPNEPGKQPIQSPEARHDPFADAVSPVEDPSVLSKVQEVLSQAIGHTTMPAPVSDVVDLPVGLLIGGTTVKVARVRELTGADEEEIVRAAASDQIERIADALLRAVVSIGDHPATPELLDRLTVADREALILGIRKITYGEEIEFEKVRCQQCGKDYSLVYDLNDVPIENLADPAHSVSVVELRRGRTARVRLATGADQKKVLRDMRAKNLNPAEQDSLLLSLLIVDITGPDGTFQIRSVDDARALSMADRAAILKEINNRKIGPQYEHATVTCPECDQQTLVPLTIDILFRS